MPAGASANLNRNTAPMESKNERDFANLLHSAAYAAIKSGDIDGAGILRAIAAVVGGVVYTENLTAADQTATLDTFIETTRSACAGFQLYAAGKALGPVRLF
jgi:hypothetical protein